MTQAGEKLYGAWDVQPRGRMFVSRRFWRRFLELLVLLIVGGAALFGFG